MERREELTGSNLITIEEIQLINGGDQDHAEKEFQSALRWAGNRSDYLMVSQYCNYAGLDEEEIFDFLGGIRYTPDKRIRDKFGLPIVRDEEMIDWDQEDMTPFHPDESHVHYREERNWGMTKREKQWKHS